MLLKDQIQPERVQIVFWDQIKELTKKTNNAAYSDLMEKLGKTPSDSFYSFGVV